MFFRSPFQKALERGMKPGADLSEELDKIEGFQLATKKDALALVAALKRLPQEECHDHYSTRVRTLTGMFQEIESGEAPAFEILCRQALPELLRIYDQLWNENDPENDDLLFILKIFAMYGYPKGVDRLILAAQQGYKSDNYFWHVAFQALSNVEHVRGDAFAKLSHPLPKDFIAVSLMDAATGVAIESGLEHHPFDTPAGYAQLERWLVDSREDQFSYAHSAAATLPFMSSPARERLLALAMDHVSADVQIEAAWAAAKIGNAGGITLLARACLDPEHSQKAQLYLRELDRADAIPVECDDADFQAKAKFLEWLKHPNELGHAPDELDCVDQRMMVWPGEQELKPFWIFRYRVHDKTGLDPDDIDCGVVGSMTWCFFYRTMHLRPPEDVYAIHCVFELEQDRQIVLTDATEPGEYASYLRHWTGPALENARIVQLAEIQPALNYPTGFVCLAEATLAGQAGWVALDGPRSAWYAQGEMPETLPNTVLRIHLGRQLLGFTEPAERKRYFVDEQPALPAGRVVEIYERLLGEADSAAPEQLAELLSANSSLDKHFERYAAAVAETRGTPRQETVVATYERLMQRAAPITGELAMKCQGAFGFLYSHFPLIAEALSAAGQRDKLQQLFQHFQPFWEHNAGHLQLGETAVKCGLPDLAEHNLQRVYKEMPNFYRQEPMSDLAKIWHARGKTAEAKKLLLDCLQQLAKEFQESEYLSTREMNSNIYALHRKTLQDLIPDASEELRRLKLPEALVV